MRVTLEVNQQKEKTLRQKPEGLVNGPYGEWLLHFYGIQTSSSNKAESLNRAMNEMICAFNSASHYSYSLGYGLTGLLWTIHCMRGVSEAYLNVFDKETIIPILKHECLRLIEERNYDLFSGAHGIMMYLMQIDKLSTEMYNRYITSHKENLNEGELITPTSSLVKNNKNLRGINLGIPHGVAGCLLMLAQMYEYNQDPKCQMLLENVVIYLLNKKRQNKKEDEYFTYSDHSESERAPLAWCYGDLSTGLSILKAGKSLQKSEFTETGISILDNTLERNDFAKEDLSMCHGAPCIAYLYHKAWLLTEIERYSDRSEYWAEKSRQLLDKQMKGMHSRVKFRKNYLENESLINGYPGTLLALKTIEGNISSEWESWMLL